MTKESELYFGEKERRGVWPIEREHVLLFGRAYRLLLEVMHPKVAEIINANANFNFDRLKRTVLGNTEIIFGTNGEVMDRAKIINQAHQKTGANVSNLKLFVFNMRVFGALHTYEMLVQDLPEYQKDAYVRGMDRYGLVLGVPKNDMPTNYTGLLDYVTAAMNQFEQDGGCNPAAMEICSRLLQPFDSIGEEFLNYLSLGNNQFAKFGYQTLKPLANNINSIVTRGLMGQQTRGIYELPWSEKDDFIFSVFCGVVRSCTPLMPDNIRFHKKYLEADIIK